MGVKASAGKRQRRVPHYQDLRDGRDAGDVAGYPPTDPQAWISLGSRLGTPCRTTCQPASESHQPCNAALAAVALWAGQTQNLHAGHHLTNPSSLAQSLLGLGLKAEIGSASRPSEKLRARQFPKSRRTHNSGVLQVKTSEAQKKRDMANCTCAQRTRSTSRFTPAVCRTTHTPWAGGTQAPHSTPQSPLATAGHQALQALSWHHSPSTQNI